MTMQMTTFEVPAGEGAGSGFGFEVVCAVTGYRARQPFDPAHEGLVPMTAERAAEAGAEHAAATQATFDAAAAAAAAGAGGLE